MLHNEQQHQQITPAQRALLDFVGRSDAGTLIRSLSLTMGLSITRYIREHTDDPEAESPTEKTLEAWFFQLELIEHLASVGTEPL